MRVLFHPRFNREWPKTPRPIREWAAGWIQAAQAPNASLSDVLEAAEKLKGGDFRDCHALKWRRKKPHGEHRLVFEADEERDTVIFFHLGPREDDYKTAARRVRTMRHPAGN